MNETAAFVIAAAALLGSPGPGITALVAVGRSFRPDAALRFYAAMQVGLAIAAGVSAIGLAGVIQSSPVIEKGLMAVGTTYLLWLAWTMASAPVGQGSIGDRETASLSAKGAFLLGVANPKAYLAFASLFGSFSLLPAHPPLADGAMKWAICVIVMGVVDLAWLALGMLFGRLAMPPPAERAFNIVMGLLIVGACAATWMGPA